MIKMGQSLYLLDANVLIDAHRDYYPMGRVPQFWGWLADSGERGLLKIPQETYDEVADGNDAVADWLQDNAAVLLLDEVVLQPLVAQVIEDGYAPDLTDEEIEKTGRDPFLIAYALADPANRIVVSNEISSPSKTRANRKIPDVCRGFHIRAINAFALIRELDFRA